ncbi:MAG: LacI family DNA-binding transcriptional regulator [Phycisphaeraceae bacterium JB051]
MTQAQPITRATLADVAKSCGCSKATVSRILKDHDGKEPFSPKTRQQVQAVAKQLGYQANWQAKALVCGGRSHNIGLIYQEELPFMSNLMLYEAMLKALMQEIQPYNYHLIFMPVRQGASPESLLDGRLDGCVVLGSCGTVLTNALSQTRGAVVLVNVASDMPHPNISPDDQMGTKLAMKHLFDQGHKRIAYVHGTRKPYHASVQIREDTYRDFMKKKRAARHINVWETAAANELVEHYKQMDQPPTALLVYNSDSAVELLQAFWLQGVKVPDDLSIVTFNNTRDAQLAIPPLTTVSMPLAEMGQQAAHMLLEQLGDLPKGQSTNKTTAKPELICRQSVQCLAK